MARKIPEWPRDRPYFYDGNSYFSDKGGKPCSSVEDAYRERYKAEIAAGRMPENPSYGYVSGYVAVLGLCFVIYLILSYFAGS